MPGLLDFFGGGDPNEINQTYGVPQGMVNRSNYDALTNMGALLFAAGQRLTPEQRAAYIAQMPNAVRSRDTSLYNQAQTRQMGIRAQEEEDTRKRNAAMMTPESLSAMGLTPQQASILGPDGLRQLQLYNLEKRSAGTGHWASSNELPQGADPKNPIWIGPDGQPKAVGTGGTTINNAVNPIMKGVGDQFDKSLESARSSAGTIGTLNAAREQLDASGGIISGTGASAKLDFAKAAKIFGVDDPRITNTETFRAAVKPVVLSTVKSLGSGTAISNADREFAEKAVGGDINLDEQSIRKIFDITERAARGNITYHNNLAGQMIKASPELGNMAPMLTVPMPEAYQPKQQPAAQPQVGPARVMNKAQYDQLPAGAQYMAPDGSIRTKGGI